ncbi:MAG: hypothetical protein IT335_00455 [Thermomicrobiales bacterium]|nr:hypothetical protein [Thermomicrobiales bacterium]
MAVADIRFHSESFGRWVSYSMILPEQGEGPFPVVMQLHGLGDDHRSWIDRSNIVRYADDHSLAIVLPDGGTSGYLNWKKAGRLHRQAWESLIARDIPDHLRRHFNVTPGPWGIGGLSMGGYGAMHIGLAFPEQFASIWSHSAAFHLDDYLDPDLIEPEEIARASIKTQAKALLDSGQPLPVVSFDCGADDELLPYNRDLHTFLEGIGFDHHYAEHPGGHTWGYWDAHVGEALAQHSTVLQRAGESIR